MKRVLVISNKSDIHTDSVISHLNDMAEVIRINTEDFRAHKIEYISENQWTITTPGGRILNPCTVDSVYVRRISPMKLDDVSPEYREFVDRESKVMLDALPTLFSDVVWMDNPTYRQIASNKVVQLMLAERCGLSLPQTCITNQPSAVRSLCVKYRSIYKPLAIPVIDFGNSGISIINTAVLDNNNINELEKTLPTAPGIFQRYIEKNFELRIHVIGSKVMAVKIDSQKLKEAQIDWRKALEKVDYEEYLLPADLEDRILRFMGLLRLNFGIIDMIVTPEREYVFLEVNPNGNWLWIEEKINIPISYNVAKWLTKGGDVKTILNVQAV